MGGIAIQNYKATSQAYKKRRAAVATWVYGHGRPIQIVEDAGFRDVLRTYDPRMPSLTASQIKLEVCQSSPSIFDSSNVLQAAHTYHLHLCKAAM